MYQRLTIYSIAALFSIILSVWAAVKTSVINPDAICYIYSAAALEKGFSHAIHLCDQAKWPLYSILIFGLAKWIHFSYAVSAYVLDGFFSLISVLVFIAIIHTLTDRIRVMTFALCVILLAHEFNGLRVDIIRDHGFWAFYLLSLFFMLQYFIRFSEPKKNIGCYAFLWNASVIIATLFRIEGGVFLLFLPWVAFFDNRRTIGMRIKAFLQLNGLTVLGGSILLAWIFLSPGKELGRLTELEFQFTHGMNVLIQSFHFITDALKTHILNDYSIRDANWVAVGMLMSWYIFCVISNVSLVYAVLIIYAGWKNVVKFTASARLVLRGYILINVLVTFIFLVDDLFLSTRYLIALSLVLMIWVPFALDHLMSEWHKRQWPVYLAGLFIFIYGLGGIFDFGHSKQYIRQGGDWLAIHANATQKIYSNDYQLLYYSKQLGDSIFSKGKTFQNLSSIAQGKWQQYDYLALRLSQNELTKNNSILQEITMTPVVIFKNDRDDQVRIYEVHPKK